MDELTVVQNDIANTKKKLAAAEEANNEKLIIVYEKKLIVYEKKLTVLLKNKNILLKQAATVPSQPVLNLSDNVVADDNPISIFWKYIFRNKVKKGNQLLYLKKGWLSNQKSLFIRPCYINLYNEIISGNFKLFLVKGSPGIGKTLFVRYFIYQVVLDYYLNRSNNLNPFPTFVLSNIDGKLFFLTVKDEKPLVFVWNETFPNPTYFISDTKPYIDAPFNKAYIHVTSISNHNYESLEKKAWESQGRIWNMPLFSFEEYLKISLEKNQLISQFKFDIFGGSARLLTTAATDIENKTLYNLIAEEMEVFFSGVDYSFTFSNPEETTKRSVKELVGDDVWENIIRVITRSIMKAPKGVESSLIDVTRKSVFILRYVELNDNQSAICYEEFASKFMKSLAGTICRNRSSDIFKEIAKIFGKSGEGNAFERIAHESIFQLLHSNRTMTAKCLPDRGTMPLPDLELKHQLKRKVFIRKIEDIRLLTPYEDYGIFMTPNFPLIDSLIRPDVLFQMTISQSHKGANDKLTEIVEALQDTDREKENTKQMRSNPDPAMVFVLNHDNFKGFKKIKGLDINQYKFEHDGPLKRKIEVEEKEKKKRKKYKK